ncbi:UNVERIFIED_CONTAM: hypothetical protein Scaly_2744600 [Sesamum calycinum]|uniref:MULE transposase domain-containing protein n=1 Tax=Sesamum calycinum TaxID=2727403 RepID=A0AAW2J0W8_9LAMI
MKARGIRNELKKFGVNPQYMQIYRAKKKAMESIEGSYAESFGRMSYYADLVLEKNEGSVGCSPFLGFDGCHLKGPFGGVLLAAIGLDGNNGLFPVAFAVVESECKESWTFFFENLSMLVGGFSVDKPWTFMSDRQKGLVETINEVVPHAINRRVWDISGIPCRHAALGISHRREDLDSYCDSRFRTVEETQIHVPLSKLTRKRKTPPLAGRKRKAAVISSSQPPAPAQVSSSQPLPKKDPVVPSMHAAGSSSQPQPPSYLGAAYLPPSFWRGIGVSPHKEIRSKKHNDAKGAKRQTCSQQ